MEGKVNEMKYYTENSCQISNQVRKFICDCVFDFADGYGYEEFEAIDFIVWLKENEHKQEMTYFGFKKSALLTLLIDSEVEIDTPFEFAQKVGTACEDLKKEISRKLTVWLNQANQNY